jgi:uncharacterized protein DUF5681
MRGRPFQHGNKFGRGRPPGSRNKIARACQETLENYAESLMKKCVYMASQGNPTAMKLCIERLAPARRHGMLNFKLPVIKTLTDVDAASEKVVSGVARGQLAPAEGQAVSQILEGRRRVIETQELDQRIRALEEINKKTTEPGAQ